MWNPVILGQKERRWVITSAVALAAVILAGYLAMRAISSGRAAQVAVSWDETIGSMEDVLERYPRREANDEARRLERLSAAIGVDLATRSAEGRDRPDPPRAAELDRIKPSLGSYLKQQLEKPERRIDPPPPDLERFLEARAADLDALRRELRAGGDPRWELQLDLLLAAPIPNLLGQIYLQKLLLADALVRTHHGDHATALADLEASWRLNTALRDDPVLITQLIAIAVARNQVGCLRKLEAVPPRWRDRLREHDYRVSFVNAALLDAWIWTQIDDLRQIGGADGYLARAAWSLTKPYVKYCLADVSEEVLWRLRYFRDAGPVCDVDLATGDLDLGVEIPAWNLVGGWSAPPDLSGAALRVTRLELDLELTERILRAGEAREEERAAWPDLPDGAQRCRSCPRERWVYRLEADGSLTIELSRGLSWGTVTGPVLPTRFTLPPP